MPFWLKVSRAIQRLAGAFLLVGADWLFNKGLSFFVAGWPAAEKFLFIVATAVFAVVYLILLLDIVAIFLPWHLLRQ